MNVDGTAWTQPCIIFSVILLFFPFYVVYILLSFWIHIFTRAYQHLGLLLAHLICLILFFYYFIIYLFFSIIIIYIFKKSRIHGKSARKQIKQEKSNNSFSLLGESAELLHHASLADTKVDIEVIFTALCTVPSAESKWQDETWLRLEIFLLSIYIYS